MNKKKITLFGSIDQYWFSKNYFRYMLNQYKGEPVLVQVSSFGGDVSEAVAISNLMAEHGQVTVEFIGFNASAATWMAFGAAKIIMHDDAFWLAHKSSITVDVYGSLNADALEQTIADLKAAKKTAEAIDLMIAQKYINRSGKSMTDIINMMNRAEWLNAEQVKEMGFVDEIVHSDKPVQMTNEIRNQLNAMALPIPACFAAPKEDEEHKDEVDPKDEKKPSWVNSLVQSVKELRDDILGKKDDHRADESQDEQKNEVTNQNNITMRKEFVSVNQLLSVEGLEEKEGKITLTVEQLQKLNDALSASADNKTKAEEATKNLNAVVADLDSLNDEIKNAADNTAKVQVIRDVLSKIPATNTSVEGKESTTDFSDIAVDPINSYE